LLEALATNPSPYEFVIYCFDPDSRRREFGNSFGYRPLVSHNPMLRLGYEFPSVLRRDRIDLGIFQYISPPLARTKSLLVVHDILPLTHKNFFPFTFRMRMAFLMSRSIRHAAAVVTVSQASRAAIAQRFPEQSHIHAIPEGPSFPIDTIFGSPGQRSLPGALRPRRFILNVGRIEPRKNVDLLVRAFLRSGLTDIDLVLVGSRDLGYQWQPPDNRRIVLIEGADEETLFELYRQAALFVYPSAAEGFGLPLLDAILFGLPCLSSNQTSMPEVAGALAEYFDPTAAEAEAILAARIAAHFQGRPIKAASEDERRQHARIFSWQSAAQHLLKIIGAVKENTVAA
jgi:glycosyltransferase involved in cell wall biosynthesis